MKKFKRHGRGKGAYVLIPLTRGLVAAVSPEDAERVSKYWWTASVGSSGRVENVITVINGQQERLSRFIMHLCKKNKHIIDHHNRNPLDNRRCNLRMCTCAENNRNKKTRTLHGVYENKRVTGSRGGRAFSTYTCWQGKIHYIGSYHTQEEAAKAYDNFTRKNVGKFACLNFPRKNELPPVAPPELINCPSSTNKFVGRRNRTFRFIGVRRDRNKKWEWRMQWGKKHISKTGFSSEFTAAQARDAFITKHRWPNRQNLKERRTK